MGTPAFRFVDLFAGIGGFHAALKALGGEAVYAVEVDPAAAEVYRKNWGHDPYGDITKDATNDTMNVPPHDVLVAGFPCQPFSKSGAQKGMDETRGTLYWNILKIIEAHHPQVVILENVRNLIGPRHEHEWDLIKVTLREQGYHLSDKPAIFSPHLLPPSRGGRPQVRERVFITATYDPDGLGGGIPPEPVATVRDRIDPEFNPRTDWKLSKYLDRKHHVQGCDLSKTERVWIDAWNEWVVLTKKGPRKGELPGFPVWADEWKNADWILSQPERPGDIPKWKWNFLKKNAEWYVEHEHIWKPWAERHGVFTDKFPPSRRKFEWQAQDTRDLWNTIMHFRPSGIRAKKPTYVPALVAITQTSIIGPRERRLSPREAARLQGLPDSFTFGGQSTAATYRQLGNGVNVGVVWHVLRKHVIRDEEILKRTEEGRNLLQAVHDSDPSPDEKLAHHVPAFSD